MEKFKNEIGFQIKSLEITLIDATEAFVFKINDLRYLMASVASFSKSGVGGVAHRTTHIA